MDKRTEFRNKLTEAIQLMDMRDVEESATAMIEMSRMIGGVISWQVSGNPFAQKLLIETCKDAIQDGVNVGVEIIKGYRAPQH